MRHSSLLLLLSLVVTLDACATGTGAHMQNPGDPDAAIAPPADVDAAPPPVTPDAATTSSTDAAPPPPPMNAAQLGAPCTGTASCPTGYTCLSVNAAASQQFCTLPCGGAMDTTTCTSGYLGKGTPGCFLADNPAMPSIYYCALACGPEVPVSSDGMCPPNLHCGDLDANGVNDLCSN